MERTCAVFCAAAFDHLLEPLQAGDLLVAADGGLRHVQALGLAPDVILGDFDSLGYVPQGPAVQRFPVEKDDTDSMLAARLGLARGYRRFLFYGALDGPRLDHTLANFQTLAYLTDRGGWGYLVGETYLATVLARGSLRFGPEATGIVSVFCLGPDATGVHLRGLQYPLTNAVLTAAYPLGVSNHFLGRPGEISVETGRLLVLWDRSCGLPARTNPAAAS